MSPHQALPIPAVFPPALLAEEDSRQCLEPADLDVERFHRDLKKHHHAARVVQNLDSADLSGVSGTPTFFVNGRRSYGTFDINWLRKAVKVARAREEVGLG